MLSENFTNHPVFEKLDQFNQVIISESKDKIPLNDLSFFELAFKYIKDRLNLTIPLLVQESELNNLVSEIDAAMVQINSFLGNNNVGHITNATNNLHSTISRVRNLPFPFSKGDFDFSKTIASFEHAASVAYRNLEALNNTLQQQLKTVQDDLAAKQNQLANLETKVAAKEVEIQNVLSRYNTEFETLKVTANSTIEAERKKFADNEESDRKLFKEHFEAEKEANKKIFDEQKSALDKQSGDVVDSLNNKLNEANKIVSIIGNVGVTGNYQKIANDHKKMADNWRRIAMGFMIAMSGLLAWSIIELGWSEFNLYKSLVRILAAAVLTYPAIYASKESSRHRNLETTNRNFELELASIGPFIELLPDDKKQKIKEDLVSKYFGNNSSNKIGEKGDSEDVSIGGLEKILKAILPFVKK